MICEKPLSEQDKWVVSFIASIIFLLIASPFMFRLTGAVFSKLGLETEDDGCPNLIGLLIHSAVFALLIRASMVIPIPGRN